MTENTQLLDGMGTEIHINGNGKVYEKKENGMTKISIVDHINGKEYENSEADCFIVDMERISHQLMDSDITANKSGITLQRNLSRKASQRGGDKKTNTNIGNERDANFVCTSPRGGVDKPAVVAIGTTATEVHNQTSPMAGNRTMTNDNNNNNNNNNKIGLKRPSFKRSASSSSWAMQPRKILFFFATLSSIGTMLLIFFTLAMTKLNQDDNVAVE